MPSSSQEILSVELFEHNLGPWILIACSEKGIRAIMLGSEETSLLTAFKDRFVPTRLLGPGPQTERAKQALVHHLLSPHVPFTHPLDPKGTPFQTRVWTALMRIPYGSTTTYGELAHALEKPTAYRAVASACGANPVAIVIPCHRVVGKKGQLTGFRYGLNRKKQLLAHESTHR